MSHSRTVASTVPTALISAALVAWCAAAAGAVRAQAPSADTLEAQVARSQAEYGFACAACHASDLSGGEMGPPLVGRAFNLNWKDKSAKELYERVRDTMPLGASNSLSTAAYLDIVALIIKANEYNVSKPVTEETAGDVILAP